MALQPNIAVLNLPFGQGGMEPRENRLLARPTQLLDANGVTMEDDHVRKEAGATLFGTMAGGAGFEGTLGTADIFEVIFAGFQGATTSTALGTNSSTASATIARTLAAGVTAGQAVVVGVVTTSTTAAANWSCADTAGNTYTRLASTAGAGGSRVLLFYTLSALALSIGNTITATVSVGTPNNAIVVVSVTGTITLAANVVNVGDGSGTATAVTVHPNISYGAIPVGVFEIVVVGMTTTTMTPDATGYTTVSQTSTTAHLTASTRILTAANNGVINAMIDYWPTAVLQRLVIASTTGNIFKQITSDISGGLLRINLRANVAAPMFVQGGLEVGGSSSRKLFFFNGYDVPQVATGDAAPFTMVAIANPATDWAVPTGNGPVAGLVHQGRLWGWGNANFPHTAYASLSTNHENFTGTPLLLPVDSSLGDRIWAGCVFQGICFLWKYPRGIFFLDDSSATSTEWGFRRKSEGLGCAPSPYAVCPLDDDVLFLSADAEFHLLSAVDTLGGTRASSLSYALGMTKWIRDHLDLSRLNETKSIWFGQKKVAEFAIPAVGSSDIYVLKFDFGQVQSGGPVRFSYSLRDAVTAITMRRDTDLIQKPLFAEGDTVYTTEREARVKGAGDGYTGSIQTPHHDCSAVLTSAAVGQPDLGTVSKIWEALELTFAPVAAGEVTVEIYVDFVLRETLTFDATQYSVRKRLNCGDGTTISLKITNSTASEDFKLLAATVWFKRGNEDTSR